MFVTDAHFSTAELEDYRPFVGDDVVDRIRARAAVLQGARILQVNATAIGGGVAEMLLSTVPLMRGLGLDVDWYVLDADDDFFEITKAYHNALQGLDIPWSAPGFDAYWRGCKENAQQLRGLQAPTTTSSCTTRSRWCSVPSWTAADIGSGAATSI